MDCGNRSSILSFDYRLITGRKYEMLFLSVMSLLLHQASAQYENILKPPVFKGLPSLTEMTEAEGVSSEQILFTTGDGYMSYMLRLGNSTGEPVLFQVGLFQSLDSLLTRGADEDLAYLLLKAGYDVYLGTLRGCSLNVGHVKYQRNDPRFWDFSFHEMGLYDTPAMIDVILKRTKRKTLVYIGHSMGTTAFLVMGSMRPEYCKKVRTAVLLSPVAFGVPLNEMVSSSVRLLLANRDRVFYLATRTGNYELLPRTENMIQALEKLCAPNSPSQDYCLDFAGMFLGEHRNNIDREKFGYFIKFVPSGSSAATLYNYAQVYISDIFKGLDLGPAANMKRYNSTQAPVYNVSLVSTPILLFWSRNDYLISKKSVMKLKSKLPNVIDKEADDPFFTHIDFILGINTKEMVYNPVINYLKTGEIY